MTAWSQISVANFHCERADNARDLACDDVLHLHRFHHENRLARPHEVAGFDAEADDTALQWRAQRLRAFGRVRFRSAHFACRGQVLPQDCERIRPVDARADMLRQFCAAGCLATDRIVTGNRELRRVALQKSRGDASGAHLRMRNDTLEEGEARRHAADRKLAQCAMRFPHYIGQVSGTDMHDQLGEEESNAAPVR